MHDKISALSIAVGALALALMTTVPPVAAQSIQDLLMDHIDHSTPPLDVREFIPDFQMPTVWVGTPAPLLEVDRTIRGKSITGIKPGVVHIIEFWATYCPPCIQAIPHLTRLQSEYGDRVRIIGINTLEQGGPDDRLETAMSFVQRQGDRMSYTVAVDLDDSVATTWIEGSGRDSLPSTYIVDREGRIAWFGLPAEIDEPLQAVMEGVWDSVQFEAKTSAFYKTDRLAEFALAQLQGGDSHTAYRILERLTSVELADHAMYLNRIAATVMLDDAVSQRDISFAHRVAKRAFQLDQDPGICHVLAVTFFEQGEVERAIELTERALAESDSERAMIRYRASLERFRSARQ